MNKKETVSEVGRTNADGGQMQGSSARSMAIFAVCREWVFAGGAGWRRLVGGLWLCALLSMVGGLSAARGQVAAELATGRLGDGGAVAVKLTHEKGWHTYWKNAGTGLPTRIAWSLPEGWSAGEILWPTPEVIRDAAGNITGNGYSGTVWLMARLTASDGGLSGDKVPPVEKEIGAAVKWLMCADVCVPGGAVLEKAEGGRLTAEMLEAALGMLPQRFAEWKLSAVQRGGRVLLRVEGARDDRAGDNATHPGKLHFFSEDGAIVFDREQAVRRLGEGSWEVELVLADEGARLESLKGVLRNEAGWSRRGTKGLSVDVRVEQREVSVAVVRASADEAVEVSSFFGILAAAFFGGILLNLMPCVFPVLGIKILGFVNQAGAVRRRVVAHGAVYTAGILVSFWVLAGVLFLLRAGGAELGWGFQLQSPAFVFALALVMLVFGMNLSGVFEVGGSLSRLGGIGAGGLSGSFWSGVLTTVVATPCSAPFLASALGAAFVLPTGEAFFVFTAIGLGLAAPYLLLSVFPELVRFLPRPGVWMVRLRQGLAFLLYGTLVFLVWVLAGQLGGGGLLKVLSVLALVAASLGVWGYLKRSAGWRWMFVAVGILIFAGWFAWPSDADGADDGGLSWETWSPERVEELRREGRIVYVDFTARWCATCQANKRLVFGSEEVRHFVAEKRVALLRADWTNEDGRISEELARQGRRAVPMTLVFLPGREGVVLPELLTAGKVLRVLREE